MHFSMSAPFCLKVVHIGNVLTTYKLYTGLMKELYQNLY